MTILFFFFAAFVPLRGQPCPRLPLLSRRSPRLCGESWIFRVGIRPEARGAPRRVSAHGDRRKLIHRKEIRMTARIRHAGRARDSRRFFPRGATASNCRRTKDCDLSEQYNDINGFVTPCAPGDRRAFPIGRPMPPMRCLRSCPGGSRPAGVGRNAVERLE